MAVAWLRNNETEQAISISAVIAEAKAKPLAKHGVNQHLDAESRTDDAKKKPPGERGGGNNITSSIRGTGTEYTLRRLARDCPEMLDKIEAGEMSVNQAAIAAGIRIFPIWPLESVRCFFVFYGRES